MISYEKITKPKKFTEPGRECFNCSYTYPLSDYGNDQSGFLCNQCSDFLDKYAFSPGNRTVVEIDGEKYRVWYVDINIEEVYDIIKKQA